MKLIKDIMVRGFRGITIGIFFIMTIGMVTMLNSDLNTVAITGSFFVKQYVAGAAIGFVFGALNILFMNERIGIINATVIHFIVVSVVFFPMAYYAGWIGSNSLSLLSIAIILICSYIIIWFICYIGWKNKIDNINKSLKDIRENR